MLEKGNVLKILKGTHDALQKRDIIRLKGLSNRTIHTASLSQDPDNIALAVIVYSLSKIIERNQNGDFKKCDSFCKKVSFLLDGAIKALERNDDILLKKKMQLIRAEIDKLSGKFKSYIQDVFRKGSINKASKIYEHGISMEKTASLLGITMYELASYAGQRAIDTPAEKTMTVKSRIKLVEGMFA